MRFLMAALAALVCSTGAQAQMVSASDPEGIAAMMQEAGYPAELTVDDVGDPRIATEFNGWSGSVMFYGCDEDSHEGCDSVQLTTGFDRETAMDSAAALDVAMQWRYVAVSLDDEGDPYLRWDIVTEDGIPASVFLSALRRYADNLDAAAEMIFAGE